jgi:hypothetical protein
MLTETILKKFVIMQENYQHFDLPGEIQQN